MVFFGLVSLLAMVYAMVDVTRTPGAQIRTLPKPLWYLLLLVMPLVGAVAWLLVGRPKPGDASPAPAPPARPIAPDDDEDFLRELRRRRQDPRDDAA